MSQHSNAQDSQDFDDLIFALKTGVLTPSETSHPVDRPITTVDDSRGTRSGHFERKRINIADTHV